MNTSSTNPDTDPSSSSTATAATPSSKPKAMLAAAAAAGALFALLQVGLHGTNSAVTGGGNVHGGGDAVNDPASESSAVHSVRRRTEVLQMYRWAEDDGDDYDEEQQQQQQQQQQQPSPSQQHATASDEHDDSSSSSVVTSISLLGERHSGTNWITAHLQECFGDDLEIKVSYSRYKHWFQHDFASVRPKSHAVVAMFRDPYDWVKAMHERPHHAHHHLKLTWKEFVTREWLGPRRSNDYAHLKRAGGPDEAAAEMGTRCVGNYSWNEVVPCDANDSAFFDGYARYMYELNHDGSGRAYPSIVNLRKDKILNFMTVPDMMGVKSFHPYQYEYLNSVGTAKMIEGLEKATGKTAKCQPIPGTGAVKHKRVVREFLDWMNDNVDWEVEALIGYEKDTSYIQRI